VAKQFHSNGKKIKDSEHTLMSMNCIEVVTVEEVTAKPVALFFCVRAISASISLILSRIPIFYTASLGTVVLSAK
jgi:hypothetical protein